MNMCCQMCKSTIFRPKSTTLVQSLYCVFLSPQTIWMSLNSSKTLYLYEYPMFQQILLKNKVLLKHL